MLQIDPLILKRKPREDMRHYGGTSWLGGIPALASKPWPRSKDGMALSFLGQLDLGVLSTMRPESPLPREGALAFFADLRRLETGHTPDHAVLHLPLNQDFDAPPDDLPPLYGDDFGSVFRYAPAAEAAPRVLPRWPISFVPLPWPQSSEEELPDGHAEQLGLRGENRLSVRDEAVAAALPRFTVLPELGVHWNHSLHLYGSSMIQALRAIPHRRAVLEERLLQVSAQRDAPGPSAGGLSRLRTVLFGPPSATDAPDDELRAAEAQGEAELIRARLDEMKGKLPAFHTFVSEVAEWADRRPAWELTSPEDRRRLVAMADRCASEFKAFDAPPYDRATLCLLGDDTLWHMAHAGEAGWPRLPRAVRDHINRHEMMPDRRAGWHQAFGAGGGPEGRMRESTDDRITLLRIVNDDFMGIHLGDRGAMRFRITPQNAAAGFWDTTECVLEYDRDHASAEKVSDNRDPARDAGKDEREKVE